MRRSGLPESGFNDTESEKAPGGTEPCEVERMVGRFRWPAAVWGCLGASWRVVGVDDFVAGVGFGDDVAAVVDVVVAVWAGEAHGVDVG